MSAPPKKPFKIKVLPKKEGPVSHKKSRRQESSSKKTNKDLFLTISLAVVGALALGGLYLINTQSQAPSSASDPAAKRALQDAADQKLTRYLQDSQKKAELQSLKVQMENLRASTTELPAFLPLEEGGVDERRVLGVELEPDPSMDRIYDELYGTSPGGKWMTPEERISARLAERKWLYNYEKEEKKMYIRNFIAAAREAGYEVQINEDLIVTHVRPLTSRPKVPLDKVIENFQFSR